MAKIALVTDTHFGARGESSVVLEHMIQFFEQQFFPYLQKHNITDVIHLGDLVDKRTHISIKVLADIEERVIQPLMNLNTHILVGNHDSFYKNTILINATRELFGTQLRVHDEPTTVAIGTTRLMMLPWITPENHRRTMNIIQNYDADYCFGHLEINGFPMSGNRLCDKGLTASMFNNFKKTFSGHFHNRSEKGNIKYLGCPYHITWEDYKEVKGFHILDTATGDVEFIPNNESLFSMLTLQDVSDIPTDATKYGGKFTKIIVQDRSLYANKQFNEFIKEVENKNPIKCETIDVDVSDIKSISNTDIEEVTNTQETIISCVNDFNSNHKDQLLEMSLQLYKEAQQIEG